MTAATAPVVRRRDLQKDQTRLDLALAAFELAREHGLAAVRVPQIAAATGVSPRTFNNYFASKEAAIAWPATLRGEYLKATTAIQSDLADAVARRLGVRAPQLEPQVLAGVVTGAERAAMLYWARQPQPSASLTDVIRAAVSMAVRGMALDHPNRRSNAVHPERSRLTLPPTAHAGAPAGRVGQSPTMTAGRCRRSWRGPGRPTGTRRSSRSGS